MNAAPRGILPGMFLADTLPVVQPPVALVATLDGVTTVLVAFLFVCLVLPSMVRNRSQFYAAMACLVGVIVAHTLSLMFDGSPAMLTGLAVATGALQVVGFLLLVLCVGGLTVRQLAGDMAKAYEVIRRGETTKEVIIPIGEQAGRRRGSGGEVPRNVYRIDGPPAAPPAMPPVADEEDEDEGIPLK